MKGRLGEREAVRLESDKGVTEEWRNRVPVRFNVKKICRVSKKRG